MKTLLNTRNGSASRYCMFMIIWYVHIVQFFNFKSTHSYLYLTWPCLFYSNRRMRWRNYLITYVKSLLTIDCWWFCPPYYYCCCNSWPGEVGDHVNWLNNQPGSDRGHRICSSPSSPTCDQLRWLRSDPWLSLGRGTYYAMQGLDRHTEIPRQTGFYWRWFTCCRSLCRLYIVRILKLNLT